jgi:hypothetical protein
MALTCSTQGKNGPRRGGRYGLRAGGRYGGLTFAGVADTAAAFAAGFGAATRFVAVCFAATRCFGLNGSSDRTDVTFRGATPAATLHNTSPPANIRLIRLPRIPFPASS